jgi:signal transduction histidine kinase
MAYQDLLIYAGVGAFVALLSLNILAWVTVRRRQQALQRIWGELLLDLSARRCVEEVMDKMADTLRTTLRASHTSFLLRDGASVRVLGEGPQGAPFPVDNPFLAWIEKANRVVQASEVADDPEQAEIRNAGKDYFQRFNARIVLPLIHCGELIGVMHLGGKDNLKPYPPSEVAFLSMLRIGAAIAISNAILHDRTQQLHETLQRRVAELEAANRDFQSVGYAISHDLRTPLRSIDGFSQEVLDTCGDRLDADAIGCLHRVRKASQRMGVLIDALLDLRCVAQDALLYEEDIDLAAMAEAIVAALHDASSLRQVAFHMTDGMYARGDVKLLRVALWNLLDNAWKFTANRPDAVIEFGMVWQEEKPVYFVRDNGAGFDMAYINKLFLPFTRLHKTSEFPGEGAGLMIVKRAIERHGGTVWAEGVVDQGATFYFTLG